MAPALAPVFVFLGMLLSQGRNLVDFTNDILNNVVSITGDAHQARVAQDIFRQEVRYERSLQIREDIRDQRKVMLESVTSYLYFGSIILATCFVTVIEGFPPINSNRMVVDWWLLFASWAITFELLAMWYALCFQVKLSQSARERLLRRYRYRLADDQVVDRMGGKNLVNTMFDLNKMMANSVTKMLSKEDPDVHVAPERVDQNQLRTRVRSLDQQTDLHCAPLRKQMNAWMHKDGIGYAKPIILDAPYFLMGETLLRQVWHFSGEKPLLLRVRGEATLYLAAQCPPLGGSDRSNATMHGLYKAVGADVPEWPEDELPVITAGFHPAWQGPSGYGELQRVDGVSIFIDEPNDGCFSIEIPVYKIVLDKPNPNDGYVDVIICWQFQSYCEAPVVILRKGHVHCKEEDWPMAEFNEEIRQIMPLQDYSGWYMRRGTVCLMINVFFAVLSRLWLVGQRPMWWAENVLMIIVFTPACLIMYVMPISISSTVQALRMSVINRVDSISEKGIDAAAKWMEKQLSQGSLNTRQNIITDDVAPQEKREHRTPSSPMSAYTKTAPAGLFSSFDTLGSKDGSFFGAHNERDYDSPRRVVPNSNPGAGMEMNHSPERESTQVTSHLTSEPPRQGSILSGCCESPAMATSKTTIRNFEDIPVNPVASIMLGRGGSTVFDQATASSTLHGSFGREPPQPSSVPFCSRLCGGPEVAKPQRILVTCPEEVTSRKNLALDEGMDSSSNFNRLSTGSGERTTSKERNLRVPIVSLPTQTRHISTCCSKLERCCPPCLRCIPRSIRRCCRRCSKLRWEGGMRKLYGDTANYRMLSNITSLLDFLFVLSVLFVLGGPAVDWFRVRVELGAYEEPNDAYGRRLDPALKVEAAWTLWPVTWPPFLDVTAAALNAQGDTLYAASGSILYTFKRPEGSPAFSAVGAPQIYPEAVRGLCFAGTSLLAVSDAAVYEAADASESSSSRGSSTSQPAGLLGLAHTALRRGRELVPLMTHGLSPISTATAIELAGGAGSPSAAPSSIAIVVARRGGEVQFTANIEGKLTLIARIEHSGQALWNVTGLHGSAATAKTPEPLLWAATGAGDIVLVGLNTGRLFAKLPRPPLPELLQRQHLRGGNSTQGSDGVLSILALTGNATHLVAIARVEGQLPVVLSTLYESLVTGDSDLEL